jgi:hypothetical protein
MKVEVKVEAEVKAKVEVREVWRNTFILSLSLDLFREGAW